MAKLNIDTGASANDKSGDTLRVAFGKANSNFTELYTLTGGTSTALTELAQDYASPLFNHASHTNITATYDDANNKILLTGAAAQVQTDWNASSGLGVVLNKPALFSGSYTDLTSKPTIPAAAVWPVTNTAGASGPTKVAIGANAGNVTQGYSAVAVGANAGETSQGNSAVAIGEYTGTTNQGDYAVAVGRGAGYTAQGINAVAIGRLAGQTSQAANTIILNATGSAVNGVSAQTNSFYVAPIRSATVTSDVLYYNTTTKEVTYAAAGSVSSLVNGAKTVSLASTGVTTFPTFQTGTESLSIQGSTVGSTNAGLSILAKNEVLISADLLGTAKNWQFDIDGSLTFPNATVQTTAWTGSVSSLVNGAHQLELVVYGATPYVTFPAFNGGQVFIQGSEISTDGSIYVSGESDVILSANVTATNGPRKNWTFGTDGTTTFPSNSIKNSLDSSTAITTQRTLTANNSYTNVTDFSTDVDLGGGLGVIAGWYQRNASQIEFALFGPSAFISYLTGLALGRTVIVTYNTSGGTATLTGTVTQAFTQQGQNDPNNPSWGRVSGRIDATLPAGQLGIVSINFPVYSTSTNNWTFGTTGTLTFPDATTQTTAWKGIPGPYADDAAAATAGVAVNYPYHKTGTSGQVFVRLT